MALRSLPAAIEKAPFDERNSLRLWHHVLIATVGSFDADAAKKSAWTAFGGIGYKNSIQSIHNENVFFTSTQPNQDGILYGDEQLPTGTLRREVAENAISNALSWAIQFSEPERAIAFGGGHLEMNWLAGSDHAGKLAASDAARPDVWQPLWGEWGLPQSIDGDYSDLDDFFDQNSKTWGFWHRWFKAIHDGDPMPWELSRMIALELSAQDWRKGARHVAFKIEEIEARFWVRSLASDLSKERSPRCSQARFGIGGNNPPEEFEIPVEINKQCTIIWAAIDEITEHTGTRNPVKLLVQAALDRLVGAFRICLKWVATKVDLAVDTAIKWAIPTAGGYLMLDLDKIPAFIDAVKGWVSLLP
mmetsp:Transcript_23040/g.39081  ORF Transcript_23040/g.39081 Transcript_23040/m.39081 type:complete len:360 (+) Transcript_23040:322-1401(+)